MEAGLVILAVIVIFIIVFAAKGLVIVQQAETLVIERLGRFDRMLKSGINIIWPIVDRPRSIEWRFTREDHRGNRIVMRRQVKKIDLRETVYDFPRQNVITKDNVVTEINAMLYFQITDPKRAVYEIANGESYLLTDTPANDFTPVWSPDERVMAFISDINGLCNLYLLELKKNSDHKRIYSVKDRKIVTNVTTGVVGLTEDNPALTWAKKSGRLLFSGFSKRGWDIFVPT